MEKLRVRIENKPDLVFEGDEIASVRSYDDQAMGSQYSGEAGRWTELALYKTKGGKYVCEQINCTRWQGERAAYLGKVCESESEVIEFFGYGWLAKELYEEAGFDVSENIE